MFLYAFVYMALETGEKETKEGNMKYKVDAESIEIGTQEDFKHMGKDNKKTSGARIIMTNSKGEVTELTPDNCTGFTRSEDGKTTRLKDTRINTDGKITIEAVGIKGPKGSCVAIGKKDYTFVPYEENKTP